MSQELVTATPPNVILYNSTLSHRRGEISGGNLWASNPNLGQLPVLSGNNVLTVGNAGAGGSTTGTGGSAGEVGRSGQRNW
jgi:hypothetical protein